MSTGCNLFVSDNVCLTDMMPAEIGSVKEGQWMQSGSGPRYLKWVSLYFRAPAGSTSYTGTTGICLLLLGFFLRLATTGFKHPHPVPIEKDTVRPIPGIICSHICVCALRKYFSKTIAIFAEIEYVS